MSLLAFEKYKNNSKILSWVCDFKTSNIYSKASLLNVLEEKRINELDENSFINALIEQYSFKKENITSLKKSVFKNKLFLSLESDMPISDGIDCIHFASLRYLVENDYIDIPLDSTPPSNITIKRPLGYNRRFFWATFIDEIKISDANHIRNLLGLPSTIDDYLFAFPFRISKNVYVPTSFDACFSPPFRPYHSKKFGYTRNLVDDKLGVPEIIVLPLTTLSESPIGYLYSPKLNLTPDSYLTKRQIDLNNNGDYKKWRKEC